ncbi:PHOSPHOLIPASE-RELATED [Salix viminalis]|uniref:PHOSPHOLIPASE-RELATED n=1 Tax=Salix viminalis TaxID=40686 RepID=A0A9Q0Z3U9_SALVM|nr:PHOSPHOLIPASE-RELATED [Salix viminalis]
MAREIGNVMYDEEFILNSRGLKLFTCKWIPINQEPKALIFICHGYAMECSITMNSTAIRLAKAGYAVYGLDYEGHGKSAGLQGYVENMDYVINDCSSYFTSICEKQENKQKMRYLLGESLGGSIALLLHRKKPDFWSGAILVAPMCKIADDMRPPEMVITLLSKLCRVIPTWKIIPTQDIVDIAFKVPEVRQKIRENPYCYKGKPRLKTGHELLRISLDLEERLQEVSLPFIVLHGEEDKVTDKSVSEELLRVASSSDKTLKLYPEMWHGLLYGETVENSNKVFEDIIVWLGNRAGHGDVGLEREQKHKHDGFSNST